jgi:hypothetical protein
MAWGLYYKILGIHYLREIVRFDSKPMFFIVSHFPLLEQTHKLTTESVHYKSKMFYIICLCGLYYKSFTIVNYDRKLRFNLQGSL